MLVEREAQVSMLVLHVRLDEVVFVLSVPVNTGHAPDHRRR